MAQLIDKDAVLAEIEKLRKNAWESFQKGNSTEEQYYLRYGVIQDILSFLNILEVRKVDLDGISRHYALNNSPWDDCRDEIQDAYKVGFELGLKAQKGEEV